MDGGVLYMEDVTASDDGWMLLPLPTTPYARTIICSTYYKYYGKSNFIHLYYIFMNTKCISYVNMHHDESKGVVPVFYIY
jgi:hypothetical protein